MMTNRDKDMIRRICKKDKFEFTEDSKYYSHWKRYKTKKQAKNEADYMVNEHPFMKMEDAKVKKSKCGGWTVYVGQTR